MNRRNLLKNLIAAPAAAAVAKAGGELAIADNREKALEEFRKNSKMLGEPMPNMLDVRDHILYDRIHVPAHTLVPEKFYLFQDPVGHHAPGSWETKTLLDTNMYQACRLPPPEEMLVNRIMFLINPGMDEEDLVKLVTNSFYEFQLLQKIIARAPLLRAADTSKPEDWLDNFGKYTVATRSTRIGEEIGVVLTKPIGIFHSMHFSMGVYNQAWVTKAPVDVYVMLDGVGRFAVQ